MSSRFSNLLLPLAALLSLTPISWADANEHETNSDAIERCDSLAGDPYDPNRSNVFMSPRYFQIDAALAVPACKRAKRLQPHIKRFDYQLAIAQTKDEDSFSIGWDRLRQLIDDEYSAAMVLIATELSVRSEFVAAGLNRIQLLLDAARLGNPTAQFLTLHNRPPIDPNDPTDTILDIVDHTMGEIAKLADRGEETAQLLHGNSLAHRGDPRGREYLVMSARNGNPAAPDALLLWIEEGNHQDKVDVLTLLKEILLNGNIFVARALADLAHTGNPHFLPSPELAGHWKGIFIELAGDKFTDYIHHNRDFWLE